MDCENIDKCGFFQKYQATKNLACKGFMLQFCKGAKQNDCERKKYKAAHGAPPADNMMPNGGIMAD
ncbi:MAG: hypothetical protein AB7E52_02860 [Bdellovibrionales bacterium]